MVVALVGWFLGLTRVIIYIYYNKFYYDNVCPALMRKEEG
jgi:hypothetical protein